MWSSLVHHHQPNARHSNDMIQPWNFIATDKRGYHWGASNEYPQHMFCGEIRNISALFGWKKCPICCYELCHHYALICWCSTMKFYVITMWLYVHVQPMPYLTLWDKILQDLAHLEGNSYKKVQISQNFQTILQQILWRNKHKSHPVVVFTSFLHEKKKTLDYFGSSKVIVKKIPQNFVKSPLKFCLISQLMACMSTLKFYIITLGLYVEVKRWNFISALWAYVLWFNHEITGPHSLVDKRVDS